MDFDLNDEQRAIREAARGVLKQRSPAARIRECAERGTGDDDLWLEMCELGWAGIAVPEEFGGQGLGLVELCIVLEEQGATLSPTPLLPTSCAQRLLVHSDRDDQRQRWLPELASGAARGAIGELVGGAAIVAGAPDAHVALLADGDETSVLQLEGVAIEPLTTIDPLRGYARVEEAGEPLTGNVRRGLDEAMICVSAELLGVARRSLEMTLDYVKERKQFGVPVGSFQAVSHKCAEMLLHVESARAAVLYAAWAADAMPQLLSEAAAMTKFVCSTGAVSVTSAAIQAHGGVGFTWEADLHWWYKRAQLDAQLLGGASVHRARLGELLAQAAGDQAPAYAP